MKRLMSLILSLLMLIGVFTLNASAEQVGLSTETEDDYLTVVATDASPEFIEEVEDAGVNVTDTTVFQMTPVAMEGVSRSTASNENGTALVVTNQTGDMVTKDVFVPMEEDSVGFQLSPETRASGNFTYNATLVGSGKVTIRGTATFNQYDAFSGLGWIYFRPLSAQFSYTKNTSCTVSYIELEYECNGPICTYPDLVETSQDADHIITVYRSSPATGTTYVTNQPYDAAGGSKVIRPYLPDGHTLTFRTEVDGTEKGMTVRIN